MQENSTSEGESAEEDLPDPERPTGNQRAKISRFCKVTKKSSKSKAKEVMDDEEISLAKANERNNTFFKQQVKEDQEFNEKMKIVVLEEVEVYKCLHEGCGREFIYEDKYKARAHVLSHRGKKTALKGISSLNLKKCLKCHQMFNSKEIHKHYQNVHAVYKDVCDKCGKEFPNFKLLKQHEQIHQKIKCPLCSREFARKCKLKKHIETVHGATSKNDIKKELEAVVTWTNGEVKLWTEKFESIEDRDVKEVIIKKLVAVRKFDESLWLKYAKLVGTTESQAEEIVKEALEMLEWSMSLWLLRIRMDPSQETLELAVRKVGDQWGSSEIWETLLQLKKVEEDFYSVANLYQQVLAVPTPNLLRFKDEALVFMSNLCETVTERDVAVETIEELFNNTNKKKEKFEEFEELLAVDSRNLDEWKRYVDKLEEVYEYEEGQALSVTSLALRASVQCGEQEDLWFWLVELGVQVKCNILVKCIELVHNFKSFETHTNIKLWRNKLTISWPDLNKCAKCTR